ncbi:MAG: nitronate monooxygenase [Syntrophomonadaceae bacterium]|jgi:nitronate monooxygenase|nr:nitronate monooxygenase [Syntrophomonadaceae bacterium]
MKLPELHIGNHTASIPIVQGGMGVGISLSGLASAVAREGGVGTISAVEIGMDEPDYRTNKRQANVRALRKEIRRARELCPGGVLGVNIMVAINNFDEMVRAAVDESIDLLVAGAGLPLSLPQYVMDTSTAAVPIVSSPKAIQLIARRWHKRYNYCPDAVIVEGPLAGGHLGFSLEQLEHMEEHLLEDIARGVIEAVKPFEDKFGRKIPVIAAGGIYDGQDIARFINLGCAGVQMGTRFVATHECDASDAFKEAFLRSGPEDVVIIKSPVGMPGRAIKNEFIEQAGKKTDKVKCRYNCLKPCNPRTAPYCIADALINAKLGHMDKGFAFAGHNAYRIKQITSVKELMNELVTEARSCLSTSS